MPIGRILFEDRICNAIYEKSEKKVFEIFSEISEVMKNTSEKIDISSKGIKVDEIKILTPIIPSKIVGIGRNYAGHTRELGNEFPEFPSVFLKQVVD